MSLRLALLVVCALGLIGCGDLEEAPRVELPVFVDSSGLVSGVTDLGYQIELTEARAMIENITFAIAGEAHAASLWRRISSFVIPTARAHPGHFQGGDVTGELRGRFVLSWLPASEDELGLATLLVGAYKSANFTFALASTNDGLAGSDSLLGHTAVLRGLASRGGEQVGFVALIDSPEGRELIGAPFELEVRQSTQESLGLRLLTRDALEGDTLFDQLDFSALDVDGDGDLVIEPSSPVSAVVDAYNLLRRAFQTHDHFDVRASIRAD